MSLAAFVLVGKEPVRFLNQGVRSAFPAHIFPVLRPIPAPRDTEPPGNIPQFAVTLEEAEDVLNGHGLAVCEASGGGGSCGVLCTGSQSQVHVLAARLSQAWGGWQ